MSDWQIGDLAVCVKRGEMICEHGNRQRGRALPQTDAPLEVLAIEPSRLDNGRCCGCTTLWFAGGLHGLVQRFRKIRPDEHEACEPEFVQLLKRSKQKVSA